MTIRNSILISLFIHGTAFASLFIAHHEIVFTFDLKQGVSSIQISVRKRDSVTQNKERTNPREMEIIVSSDGTVEVPDKKEIERNNASPSMSTKELLGALCARASYNSRNSAPEYPYLARRMGWEGRVVLSIEVLPNGRTGQVRVVTGSGYDLLDDSAVKAARQWIFFEEGEMRIPKPMEITSPPIVFVIKRK